MKYPQSVPMPRDVEDWLGGELEALGIDAVVYTRYILTLMQQDSFQFEPRRWPPKTLWSGQKREAANRWQYWDGDAFKRLAVIRCLMSVTSQNCEVESLVDELCVKLKEIGGSKVDDSSACAYQPQSSPYVNKNRPFPWLDICGDRETEVKSTDSAWTRGILRASLDEPPSSTPAHAPPYPYEPLPCLPFNYGTSKMFGNVNLRGEAPNKEDVKRLYERSSDARNLDRVIGRHDAAMPQTWNPDAATFSDPKIPVYAQNQAYFNNNHKLFSPTLFNYRHAEDTYVQTCASWSLGGVKKSEPPIKTDMIAFQDARNDDSKDICNISGEIIEEDLLISARTHFRPIRSENGNGYADGTSFIITNDLEPLQFQRSESGSLFLETGKYMEYKNDEEYCESQEFVPKFRVRQSNEKFCQTEDICLLTETIELSTIESSENSESEHEEFYFPGDDDLALDVENNLPAEDEVAQIVSSAKLDERWELPFPDKLSGETSEIWVQWGANNAALVDNLIGDDDEDEHMGEVSETDPEPEPAGAVQWPQLTPNIWNSSTSIASCDTCKRETEIDEETIENQVIPKREWQDIWGQQQCKNCKGEDNGGKSKQSYIGIYRASTDKNECKSPILRSAEFTPIKNSKTENSWMSEYAEPAGNYDVSHEISPGGKWPKIGAALSAYLEESRIRAVELLNVWSPNDETKRSTLRKANDVALRDLWSAHLTEGERGSELWSPELGQEGHMSYNNQRPVTYGLLRDELSEDGEQLMSDLSYLHLQQLGSLEVNENSDLFDGDNKFCTAAPSPKWEEGHRFISFWATWNLIDVVPNHTEATHRDETAQKERKRRHSSSQRMCELYMEGECRRPHCRFVHGDGDDIFPSDMTPQSFRYSHEVQRAFTL